VTFESGDTQVTLLELFTSEGCSSCPPADAWLSRLKGSGGLWKNVVPVAWHVDYWDRLGWRDRLAQPEFTARQYRYAANWGSGSVYTPAVVANGREWKSRELPAAGSSRVGALRVSVDGAKVSAHFTPAAKTDERLQLEVALLGAGLESSVSRGETRGRKLRHDFVVLATATAELRRTGESYAADLTLPATQTSDKPAALAAWITIGEGKPTLQATGGWLHAGAL
jgi:hypothetical protein